MTPQNLPSSLQHTMFIETEQETKPKLARAPSAESFLKYPASWYPLCHSEELDKSGKAPLKFSIFGTELIVFRGVDGTPIVMNAHCSHLGADLSKGCIQQGTIRCPYHGWRYDKSGQCIEIPGQKTVPASLKQLAGQKAFPTAEKHGVVFFFFGKKAIFDLPFFFDESPGDYLAGQLFRISLPCSWYMMGSHAFDQKHLEYVHSRVLHSPLQVDFPNEYGRRGKHRSTVTGQNIYDRLIRHLAGSDVSISMTPMGGTFVLVTGDFGRISSRFFLMAVPTESGQTELVGLVFKKKSKYKFVDKIFAPVSLAIRRWFTRGYLTSELEELGQHTYRPHMLVEHDQSLISYYRWAAETSARAFQKAHE